MEINAPATSAPSSFMLTHVGHKRLLEVRRSGVTPGIGDARLAVIARHARSAVFDDEVTASLLESGWIRPVPPELNDATVRRIYQRNPLENVSRINYEITTRCNFACLHCRNGGIAEHTDTDVDTLARSGQVFLSVGIRRFDFIGGEVSRYGDGWLALSRRLTDMDAGLDWPEPLAITVYTNGWWLEGRQLRAAGHTYASEREYLDALKASGVTHVVFSIDGPEPIHDTWRRHTGLYRRILAGIPRVIEAGLQARLSVVVRSGEDIQLRYLKPFADAIYGGKGDNLDRLRADPFNHFSNFIDIGFGAEIRHGGYPLTRFPAGLARCKAFFRPAPTLRIMANGALGICPLMHGEEAYGNIHQRPVTELLNTLHEAPLYQLHASGDIGDYLPKLDPSRFGGRFDHPCAVRVALNRLALEERGLFVGSIEKSYTAPGPEK